MDTFINTMLFDFYGNILTQKQYNTLDLYLNEDMSLGEIAQQEGISRQGVRDTIRRATSTLEEFEEKLGFVAKYNRQRQQAMELEQCLICLPAADGGGVHLSEQSLSAVKAIIRQMMNDFID